jgi:hypothetical protein
LFGTKESTAAPPLVITFTICSSDFVFLTGAGASIEGAFRLGGDLAGVDLLGSTFEFLGGFGVTLGGEVLLLDLDGLTGEILLF